MMRRSQIVTLALCLFGCGIDDELTSGEFEPVATCDLGVVHVESERAVDCDQFAGNLEIAKRIFIAATSLSFDDKFTDLRVRVWDRQILYCDQYFLGVCVHFVKGNASGGSAIQVVNLNNGGELLEHELLHFVDNDPHHTKWGTNGFGDADWLYRKRAELLNGGAR